MKNVPVAILLGIVLLAIGFFLGTKYDDFGAKNKTQLSGAELFAKKKECAGIQAGIEATIKRDWNDQDRSAWLEKVFYSPTRNTCMYTMQIGTNVNNVTMEIHNLFDALTNEKIESVTGCQPEDSCFKSLTQAEVDFNGLVDKYE